MFGLFGIDSTLVGKCEIVGGGLVVVEVDVEVET